MAEVVLTFTDAPEEPGDVELYLKCKPDINHDDMTPAERMALGVVALYRSIGVITWMNGKKVKADV